MMTVRHRLTCGHLQRMNLRKWNRLTGGDGSPGIFSHMDCTRCGVTRRIEDFNVGMKIVTRPKAPAAQSPAASEVAS